jgi:hypothetical protein
MIIKWFIKKDQLKRKKEVINLIEGTQLEDPIEIEDSNIQVE